MGIQKYIYIYIFSNFKHRAQSIIYSLESLRFFFFCFFLWSLKEDFYHMHSHLHLINQASFRVKGECTFELYEIISAAVNKPIFKKGWRWGRGLGRVDLVFSAPAVTGHRTSELSEDVKS